MPAFVQFAPVYENSSTPTSPATVTFSSNITPGNTIAVLLASQSSSSLVFNTPTDSENNIFTLGATASVGGGTPTLVSMYYACNVVGATADIITATWTGTGAAVAVYAVELSGVNAFAGCSAATGDSTTAKTGNIYMPGPGIIYVADINAGDSSGVGPGYTLITQTSGFTDILQYKIVSSGGYYNSTIPLAAVQWWGTAAIGFYLNKTNPRDTVFYGMT
jgi:hypothetical protein